MSSILEQGQFVVYAAYILIGIASFIVARMLMQEQETRAAQESLEDQGDRKASSKLVKITRPFFTQYVVPMVRGKPFWDKSRKKYRRKIISAGLREELTPDEFIAFKAFLIGFFPIVGGLLNAFGLLDVAWYYLLFSAVGGWFYPDYWANQRIKIRHKQIRKALPFIVDLLALSTEAGLDFVGAMQRVVEKANSSPLVDEFEQALKEIKVGSSRAEALHEMATRVNMLEFNSFIAILISADQMGASIGKVLRQQSDAIRNERFLSAERAGAAAAPKLMLVTAICIFPAVLLMVMGPFLLSFMYPQP